MAEKILRTEFSEEMQKSYLNYSMSVITARAIPDARDGLKPVQRRVLYDMSELRLGHDKPHRKSARIVGDTMGKYHPHGDSSIYDTLVVLSQKFKKGMALVDGHGNFGSIEGDGAAAMRYTEARLEKFAEDVYLKDLDKTVDFVPNYDESEKEPAVLPVRVPNLLVNGAEGIAVGMSTSIPPHNLGEVIDAVQAYIADPSAPTQELLKYMPGPDFPTGGIIANKKELAAIYETGAGKIRLRGRVVFEPGKKRGERDRLVVTEIPYTMIGSGINKFLTDVAALVETRKLPDVTDISNQSGKDGIRIVLELKKGADFEKICRILYKKTKLEDTFGVNMLAIVRGRPETLSLKGILENFMEFQYENTEKKYRALLEKELEQKEVREGLIAACDVIGLIIAVLRGARNLKDAKACLTQGDTSKIRFRAPALEEEARKLRFTARQAEAILEMRLYRLIGLEIEALNKEYRESLKKIASYEKILKSRRNMDEVIQEDLAGIKAEFAVPRRTELIDEETAAPAEEVPEAQEAVFVMDRFGYAKLLDPAVYERSAQTVETGYRRVIPCLTSDRLCIFTDTGQLHQIRVRDLPFARVKDKGVPLDNLSRFDGSREEIVLLTPLSRLTGQILLFATARGYVKQVPAGEFFTANRTVAATKLEEDDALVCVRVIGQETEVALLTDGGKLLRFAIEEIPQQKKGARGVRGIRLDEGEKLAAVYFVHQDGAACVGDRQVQLARLKLQGRDTKGTKVRTK